MAEPAPEGGGFAESWAPSGGKPASPASFCGDATGFGEPEPHAPAGESGYSQEKPWGQESQHGSSTFGGDTQRRRPGRDSSRDPPLRRGPHDTQQWDSASGYSMQPPPSSTRMGLPVQADHLWGGGAEALASEGAHAQQPHYMERLKEIMGEGRAPPRVLPLGVPRTQKLAEKAPVATTSHNHLRRLTPAFSTNGPSMPQPTPGRAAESQRHSLGAEANLRSRLRQLSSNIPPSDLLKRQVTEYQGGGAHRNAFSNDIVSATRTGPSKEMTFGSVASACGALCSR